jgi:TIR domain
MSKADTRPPVVFISYSHDSEDHKAWVLGLAQKLVRDHGIDVIIDKWNRKLGADANHFMRDSIEKADRVLMICTEAYVQKAEEGKGGVGYEAMIIDAELARDLGTSKFISIIRQTTGAVRQPAFMGMRFWADLSKDFDGKRQEWDDLVSDIHKMPPPTKPPLGRAPKPLPVAHVISLSGSASATSNARGTLTVTRAKDIPQKSDMPSLSEAKQQLLVAASEDPNGRLIMAGTQGGLIVQTNGQKFGRKGNPRSDALMKRAVDGLCTDGLLEPCGHRGEVFRVTHKGYQVAQGEDTLQKPDAPSLSDATQQLLMAASEDSNGRLIKVGTQGGLIVQTNGQEFGRKGDARSEALMERAVKDLCARGLLEPIGHKGEIFKVTQEGYEEADRLRKDG